MMLAQHELSSSLAKCKRIKWKKKKFNWSARQVFVKIGGIFCIKGEILGFEQIVMKLRRISLYWNIIWLFVIVPSVNIGGCRTRILGMSFENYITWLKMQKGISYAEKWEQVNLVEYVMEVTYLFPSWHASVWSLLIRSVIRILFVFLRTFLFFFLRFYNFSSFIYEKNFYFMRNLAAIHILWEVLKCLMM